MSKVRVLGAGLAGCEDALWLAEKGVQVELFEQKPARKSPAHKSENFAELVCSNSLKADRPDSASGLLKAEMDLLGSHLLPVARRVRVAAGGALAVDRDAFSAGVTALVESQPNITVVRKEAVCLDESGVELVKAILREERDRGATVVLASHDGALLEDLAGEIFSLAAGRVTGSRPGKGGACP